MSYTQCNTTPSLSQRPHSPLTPMTHNDDTHTRGQTTVFILQEKSLVHRRCTSDRRDALVLPNVTGYVYCGFSSKKKGCINCIIQLKSSVNFI